jgi:hypothetical protein
MSKNNFKEGDIVCIQYHVSVGCRIFTENLKGITHVMTDVAAFLSGDIHNPIAYWIIKRLHTKTPN